MRVLRLFERGKGASPFGPLESQIMEIVWASKDAVAVRDVHAALARQKRDLAYSTVKAVLTNLTSKGYLRKKGIGNTNYFSAIESEQKFKEKTVTEVIDSLLKNHRGPVIANLLDRAMENKETLREVEELIAKRLAKLAKNR